LTLFTTAVVYLAIDRLSASLFGRGESPAPSPTPAE
jgi:hypothetical protein